MTAPYCKKSYIGAPVKAVVHACEYCTCGGAPKGGCNCGCHGGGSGICAAVIDDANNRTYLYGNVTHENYHQPGGDCIAYAAVSNDGFTEYKVDKDEFFQGEQPNNSVVLQYEPQRNNTLMVFLNGLKQREGTEYDYVVVDNKIHFVNRQLLAKDRIEVMYTHYGR